MDLSEYLVMFALVILLGAGVPGPGDASLLAAGTLAGEGRLNLWIVLGLAAAAWMLGAARIAVYVGISYFLGAEIAKRIGDAGTKAVLGVVVIVAAGLAIRAGIARWSAARGERREAA